jgi:hypothetical protein
MEVRYFRRFYRLCRAPTCRTTGCGLEQVLRKYLSTAKLVCTERRCANDSTHRCSGASSTRTADDSAPRQKRQKRPKGAARVLTLQEALAEINYQGSGPAKNAELYRRGGLSGDKAVECVVCAILLRSESGRSPKAPVRPAAATPPASRWQSQEPHLRYRAAHRDA